MNDKTKRVFNGWLVLSADERAEFEKAVRDYHSSTSTKQRELRETFSDRVQKMQTGPLSSGCACCGR